MYWSYLAHTHIDKFLASLGMLAFYIYRTRTPEDHVLFMGDGFASCALAAFAALGPPFFQALSDAFTYGQNQALTDELS
ncbi:hypothetical protein [Endozoicomonas euniceicola]|uniref:Uncharacterized protein n=1 Tax=Endozoicomonas euniceicola TaxID=1234143 RepID=A0ABY6GYT0_9GAMM|nr:hypothetical protein [Endozoicomonas euniceicola]UYM17945.1 hypothetical protein NX720_08590 [Endozoicomonas euniceicola]